eukprot:m.168491 g.168491  ORF g.168491 m.168491 type:complete len:243 (+) comp17789_c0_seq1:2491-3219(+)
MKKTPTMRLRRPFATSSRCFLLIVVVLSSAAVSSASDGFLCSESFCSLKGSGSMSFNGRTVCCPSDCGMTISGGLQCECSDCSPPTTPTPKPPPPPPPGAHYNAQAERTADGCSADLAYYGFDAKCVTACAAAYKISSSSTGLSMQPADVPGCTCLAFNAQGHLPVSWRDDRFVSGTSIGYVRGAQVTVEDVHSLDVLRVTLDFDVILYPDSSCSMDYKVVSGQVWGAPDLSPPRKLQHDTQ